MKLKVLRLFLPLLVAGFILPLIIPGPDGRPIMSLSDWVPDQAAAGPVARFLGKLPQVAEDGPGILVEPEMVYRWQDEEGVWHFTNDPKAAPEGAVAEALPAVVNGIPAPEKLHGSGGDRDAGGSPLPQLPAMADVMDAAKQVRTLSGERAESLEQL